MNYTVLIETSGLLYRVPVDSAGNVVPLTGPEAVAIAGVHKRLFNLSVKIERWAGQQRYELKGVADMMEWFRKV